MEDARLRSISEDSSVTVLTEDGNSLQGNPFSQVVFTDLKSSYCMGSPLKFKYKLRTGTISQSGDRIAMYPVGWSMLEEFVFFVHVDGGKDEGDINFPTEGLDLKKKSCYQMCYVTAGNFFAGVSLPFDFSKKIRDRSSSDIPKCHRELIDKLVARNAELESKLEKMCLARQSDVLPAAEEHRQAERNTSSSGIRCQLDSRETVSTSTEGIDNPTNDAIEKSNSSPENRSRTVTENETTKNGPSLKNIITPKNEVKNTDINRENSQVLQATEQLLIRYQEMEKKYKNEVVKNAGLIQRCKDMKKLAEENVALKNCVKDYYVMNDGLKNKASMLEEQIRNLLKLQTYNPIV